MPSGSPGVRASVGSNVDVSFAWRISPRSSNDSEDKPDCTNETAAVIDKVTLFHSHRHARSRDATTGSLHRTLSVHTTALEQAYTAEECDENDYHLDLDSYKPVQPLVADHGVALFPVAAPHHGMDLHLLQVHFYSVIHLLYFFFFLFLFSSLTRDQ